MDNVDKNEIDHFNSQAPFWWDENGPFKTLHHINPTRLSYIESFTSLNGKKVIDVGCGGGVLTEALAKKSGDVTGIDLAQASLDVAKMHLFESELEINYQNSTVEDFANQFAESYDVVVCMEMLEHVPDPQSVVESCLKLLKPQGWLFLSTLNRSSEAMLKGIFLAEHVLRLIPKGTHHYEQLIKPSELHDGVIKAGGEVIDISGLKYNPLSTQSWVASQDVSINYMMAVKKP